LQPMPPSPANVVADNIPTNSALRVIVVSLLCADGLYFGKRVTVT
jgi:hypothetical protein